jgi:hypothetical protein
MLAESLAEMIFGDNDLNRRNHIWRDAILMIRDTEFDNRIPTTQRQALNGAVPGRRDGIATGDHPILLINQSDLKFLQMAVQIAEAAVRNRVMKHKFRPARHIDIIHRVEQIGTLGKRVNSEIGHFDMS